MWGIYWGGDSGTNTGKGRAEEGVSLKGSHKRSGRCPRGSGARMLSRVAPSLGKELTLYPRAVMECGMPPGRGCKLLEKFLERNAAL